MPSSKEIAAVFADLAQAKGALRRLRSSLSDEQKAWLEVVPFRFLDWTLHRVEHLERLFGEAARTPWPEAAALSARLLLEALWTLRWIGREPSRAREFALAGFRDQADTNQTSIVQFSGKDSELKEESIQLQKGLAEAATKFGVDLKTMERWPNGSDLLKKKLAGIVGREDRRDWDTVYALSFLLHPTPYFVMSNDHVSAFENVVAISGCAARIAQDLAAHLSDLYRSQNGNTAATEPK